MPTGTQIVKMTLSQNDVFSLTEGERGETDLLEMFIDTGDAFKVTKKAHLQVAQQLKSMLKNQVI